MPLGDGPPPQPLGHAGGAETSRNANEQASAEPQRAGAQGARRMTPIHRRSLLRGITGGAALLSAPAVLRAQAAPMRIGFMIVKTGPLASGGIQMEQGLTLYLKERNGMLAGRAVELHTADSAGAPAVART